ESGAQQFVEGAKDTSAPVPTVRDAKYTKAASLIPEYAPLYDIGESLAARASNLGSKIDRSDPWSTTPRPQSQIKAEEKGRADAPGYAKQVEDWVELLLTHMLEGKPAKS